MHTRRTVVWGAILTLVVGGCGDSPSSNADDAGNDTATGTPTAAPDGGATADTTDTPTETDADTGVAPDTPAETDTDSGSGAQTDTDTDAGDTAPAWTQKIQLYGHGFSVPTDFTSDEYQFIATTYKIFTVEKRHAYQTYGEKPNSEAATIGTAANLKAINPDIKVLLYWNMILDWGLYESQVEFEAHPEWTYDMWTFSTGNSVPMYDLNNPEVQQWWVQAVVDTVVRGNLDGVFLDAGPKVPSSMYASLFAAIDAVRQQIGEDKIVVYNGYRVPNASTMQAGPDFIAHTSGVFIEFFLHAPLDTKEEAALLFDALTEAWAADKMIIARGTPDSYLPGTVDPFLFSFASFLLFYGPNSYYLYNAGYNKTQGLLEYHPEFDLATGASLGGPQRDGWVYTREFENISVRVDLENLTASITYKNP